MSRKYTKSGLKFITVFMNPAELTRILKARQFFLEIDNYFVYHKYPFTPEHLFKTPILFENDKEDRCRRRPHDCPFFFTAAGVGIR